MFLIFLHQNNIAIMTPKSRRGNSYHLSRLGITKSDFQGIYQTHRKGHSRHDRPERHLKHRKTPDRKPFLMSSHHAVWHGRKQAPST